MKISPRLSGVVSQREDKARSWEISSHIAQAASRRQHSWIRHCTGYFKPLTVFSEQERSVQSLPGDYFPQREDKAHALPTYAVDVKIRPRVAKDLAQAL